MKKDRLLEPVLRLSRKSHSCEKLVGCGRNSFRSRVEIRKNDQILMEFSRLTVQVHILIFG